MNETPATNTEETTATTEQEEVEVISRDELLDDACGGWMEAD